ncbi:MAG: hypothetical protein IH899_17210, partial [Planctomycetes bacterium]|nr:hypothetical protein [Planctomycetota bacterium]
KLTTSGQRVLDILNRPTTDFLTLYDAKVFGSGNCKTCVAELPDAVVPKVQLGLLIIPTDKFEFTRPERFRAIIEKRKSSSFAIVAGYSVQGTVHLPGRVRDSLYALTNGLGNFFPITEATVSGPGMASLPASAVLANKSYVSCFCSCQSEAHPILKETAGTVCAQSAETDAGTAQRVVRPRRVTVTFHHSCARDHLQFRPRCVNTMTVDKHPAD